MPSFIFFPSSSFLLLVILRSNHCFNDAIEFERSRLIWPRPNRMPLLHRRSSHILSHYYRILLQYYLLTVPWDFSLTLASTLSPRQFRTKDCDDDNILSCASHLLRTSKSNKRFWQATTIEDSSDYYEPPSPWWSNNHNSKRNSKREPTKIKLDRTTAEVMPDWCFTGKSTRHFRPSLWLGERIQSYDGIRQY
jgi:hypothetical protein